MVSLSFKRSLRFFESLLINSLGLLWGLFASLHGSLELSLDDFPFSWIGFVTLLGSLGIFEFLRIGHFDITIEITSVVHDH